MKKILRKNIRRLRQSLFAIACIAGCFVSTSIFFAFHPNPVFWILPFLETVCSQVQGIDSLHTRCTGFISSTVLISILVGLLFIVYQIRRKRDWIVGLSIYVSGWVLGFICMSFIWTFLLR